MINATGLRSSQAKIVSAFMIQVWRVLVFVCAAVALTGCETTYPTRDVDYSTISLDRTSADIAEAQLLGVRVHPFDPGELPESRDEGRGLSREIRNAEGYYVAFRLKKALEQSGYWGPVRVVPAADGGGELVVKGRIVASDSEVLRLAVSVHDATGSRWLAKEYQRVVRLDDYSQWENGVEAFQPLYNEIANDILQQRQVHSADEIAEIRQVAELKFAADFAPSAFQGFLAMQEPGKGDFVEIVRLPADDDPMLQRIRRIRARDDLLVDTLDLQYEGLYRGIGGAYTQWRMARLNEINAVRDLEDKRDEKIGSAMALGIVGILVGVAVGAAGGKNCYGCASAGGAIAGVAASKAMEFAIEAAEEAEQDTEIHKAALEELGQSLSADLELTVLEIEGETIELQGTADAKFRQWREILREIYEREAGVPSFDEDSIVVSGTS